MAISTEVLSTGPKVLKSQSLKSRRSLWGSVRIFLCISVLLVPGSWPGCCRTTQCLQASSRRRPAGESLSSGDSLPAVLTTAEKCKKSISAHITGEKDINWDGSLQQHGCPGASVHLHPQLQSHCADLRAGSAGWLHLLWVVPCIPEDSQLFS